MKILVLGSAAGGGFPQWNCHCANCKGLREGTIKATARTQSSIAVSVNGNDWVLINAPSRSQSPLLVTLLVMMASAAEPTTTPTRTKGIRKRNEKLIRPRYRRLPQTLATLAANSPPE